MKFLVLAYGAEEDWLALTEDEQSSFLAQDEVLRRRGSLVAAVDQQATTVRAWDGTPRTTDAPVCSLPAPLAGFAVVEAESLEHAIHLVANTPCARAKGAVEIRPILQMNEGAEVVARGSRRRHDAG